MSIYALMILAFAMSADAFAASLAKGAADNQRKYFSPSVLLRTALIFGIIESIAPIIGWLGGSTAKPFIADWDHWIAFGLLSALGSKMIYNSLFAENNRTCDTGKNPLGPTLIAALATSIDSMIIGVSLAFVEVNIGLAALMIGCTTTLMSGIGLYVGKLFGQKLGKHAEVLGGLVLVCIGISILTAHLGLFD
ncbi:MAG: manganese efflux pump MntP family protein [Neisseria sp.]|nr:manganese efflux pump MntP family protein [Neisseria sp.]